MCKFTKRMYLSLGIPVIKQIVFLHLCLRLYVNLHVTLTLGTLNAYVYVFSAER